MNNKVTESTDAPKLIIGKLAEDVARGVCANDAAFFQREFNKILKIAKRQVITAMESELASIANRYEA